jgi:hypothetical protein
MICFLTLAATAHGQDKRYTDGNDLLVSCQLSVHWLDDHSTAMNSLEDYRDGFCRGLVTGVADASPKVCATEGITLGQNIRIVTKFLQDHPERLQLRATELVEQALAKAFPCSK